MKREIGPNDFEGTKKTNEHNSDGDTNCIGALGIDSKVFYTGDDGLGNKRVCGNNLYYSIVKIGKNTEKSPGDLWRLPIPLTHV